MIILENEQGSEGWFNDRLGVATASCFNQIMTTKQLKRSKNNYIYELAAEAITKKKQGTFTGSEHTERGHELEPKAIEYYEFINCVECKQVGLCLPFEGALYGASPDALVGDDGGLEIKSPELKTHLKYKTEGVLPDDYKHQVYGSLFVTGREWWDFMSFNELAEPFIIRTTKDDEQYNKWVDAFVPTMQDFLTDLKSIINDNK